MSESKMSTIKFQVPTDLLADFDDYTQGCLGMSSTEVARASFMKIMRTWQCDLSFSQPVEEIPDDVAERIYKAEHDPELGKLYTMPEALKRLRELKEQKYGKKNG